MYITTPILDLFFSGDEATTDYISEENVSLVLNNTWTENYEGNLSDECAELLTSWTQTNNFTLAVSDSPVRLTIATITLIENLFVIIALLNSWGSLRQNIYIFALSIAFSDCLLGFTHVCNSIVFRVFTIRVGNVSTAELVKMGPTSWFYIIRATTLMTAQVASTGNAACLVVAFRRYAHVLAPVGNQTESTATRTRGILSSSRLLTRKASYVMTATVWITSAILGIIPLFWNCGQECACFVNTGTQYTSENATRCFENHGCSYLFPPLKSVSYICWLTLFFVAMSVLIFSCIQVIGEAGGMIAFLPFRLHKLYARRRRSNVEENGLAAIPMRLRKRSVQMTYMRDMMHFMLMLSIAFVFCKLPSALLLFVESTTYGRLNVSSDVVTFLVLLGYADSIINPIIFGVTLHGAREAFKKLLVPCCTATVSVSIGKQLHATDGNSDHPQQHSTTV